MRVENAIIMAAGTSSRFAPLSYEMPKGLMEVRKEILIERQIRQLKEAGIGDIIVVTGYKSEKFEYLKEKHGVRLIHNSSYLTRNNNGSIHAVREYLSNSYVCSADNYFMENPFEQSVDESYYAAVYTSGKTDEWCLHTDEDGYISDVHIGGENAWYMLGHTFWSAEFSRRYIEILEKEYDLPETRGLLWESLYVQHLDMLKMKMRKYPEDYLFEFDTLDELRLFDSSYVDNPRAEILNDISRELQVPVSKMSCFDVMKNGNNAANGFSFELENGVRYQYTYESRLLEKTGLEGRTHE